MTAHISVPALDPSGDPATLSEPIMTGILREEMGYDGVVITDALDMAGASATYGNDRVPVLALKAGVDMLLMPPEFDVAYNAVLDAVAIGRAHRGADRHVGTPDPHPQARPRHRRRPVRRPGRDPRTRRHPGAPGDRPGDHRPHDHAGPQPAPAAAAGQRPGRGRAGHRLGRRARPPRSPRSSPSAAWPADVLETGHQPEHQATIDERRAAGQAPRPTSSCSPTGRAWRASRARRPGQALLEANGTPVVAVAVRDPYDVNQFPKVPAYLATYSYTAAALDSLVRVLFGELDPTRAAAGDDPRGRSGSRRSTPTATDWSTDMRRRTFLQAAAGTAGAGARSPRRRPRRRRRRPARRPGAHRLRHPRPRRLPAGRRRAGRADLQPHRRGRRPAARGRRDGRRRPGRPGRRVRARARLPRQRPGRRVGGRLHRPAHRHPRLRHLHQDAGADRRTSSRRPASTR